MAEHNTDESFTKARMNRSRKIAIAVLVAIIVLIVAPTVAVILLVRNYGPDVVRTAQSQFNEMQNQISDRDFRNAVAQIELHKLRSGKYPRSLQDIRYLSQMDQ